MGLPICPSLHQQAGKLVWYPCSVPCTCACMIWLSCNLPHLTEPGCWIQTRLWKCTYITSQLVRLLWATDIVYF